MLCSIEALQEKALEKEKSKLLARAARDQERIARLHNNANKGGVNVSVLEAQVQEKQRLKEREKALLAKEAERTAEMVRLQAAQEAAEAATRQALEKSIQAEWRQQADAHKDKNKVSLDFTNVPREFCGRSALQKFAGEDEEFSFRKKQQHAQMQAWVEAQRHEQAARDAAEARQKAQEIAQSRRMFELAEQQAEAEAACQAFVTQQVQAHNAALSQKHAQAKAEEVERRRAEEQALLARQRVDPLLNEVNDCVNPETRRIIPDRFRGFSTAQRQALREENHTLIQEKAARERQAAEAEKAWKDRQAQYQAMLLQQEAKEKEVRALVQQETKATLQQQKQEQAARNQAKKADAYGKIESGKGLFSKFGTSLA